MLQETARPFILVQNRLMCLGGTHDLSIHFSVDVWMREILVAVMCTGIEAVVKLPSEYCMDNTHAYS